MLPVIFIVLFSLLPGVADDARIGLYQKIKSIRLSWFP